MRRTAAAAAVVALGGAAALAFGSGAGAAAAFERVSVPNGDQQLPALIAKPSGSGRFASVVLLPACTSVDSAIERWLTRLSDRGYVAIAVNSPRRSCDVARRRADAAAALGYLRSQPYVMGDRIGALGWGSGGSAALATGDFSTAVAFDPRCARKCRVLARSPGKKLLASRYRKGANRAAIAALTQAFPAGSGQQSLFSPTSWPNAPLAPDAPLDSNQSAAWALRSQVMQFGTWVNTTTWSAPVYVVPDDQPRVAIRMNSAYTRYSWADQALLSADLSSVPLPPDALPAGPPESKTVAWSDHELIVYQPSTDTAWELYHLVKGQWGWSVTDGGVITHLSSSNGGYNPWITGKPHGMTGSGIPLLTGLQRVGELQGGSIDHAVAISIPHVRKGVVRSPATRSDGDFTTPDAIPEGTRFRLPASLDIDSLPLTPYAKMVAKAIQAHGMVVIDKNCRPSVTACPAVTFKAEDPRPRPDAGVANPYDAIFSGIPENHLFDNFPWDLLQVLA